MNPGTGVSPKRRKRTAGAPDQPLPEGRATGHAPSETDPAEPHEAPLLENAEKLFPPGPLPAARQPDRNWPKEPGSTGACTGSTLKQRGWTPTLIHDLLGPPDSTTPNPHFRNAAPMQLYSQERVEAAEAAGKFQQNPQGVQGRRQAALKAAETRSRNAVRWATRTEIFPHRPTHSMRELQEKSVIHRNEHAERSPRNRENPDFEYMPQPSRLDRETLDRLCVNFPRHECSDYACTLAETFGQTGKETAIGVIRLRIYREITRRWPDLEGERRIKAAEIGLPPWDTEERRT